MVGIRDDQFFSSPLRMQCDGVVSEDGKADLPFVAYDLYAVGFGGFMSDEAL